MATDFRRLIMRLCSDGHEEICHENRNCPLCAAQEEIDGLEVDVRMLQSKVDELDDTLAQERYENREAGWRDEL